MSTKRKVLITGGTGYIAGRMLQELRQQYDLTILDIKDTNRAGEKIEDVIITDLLDKDRDNYREYFQGVDSVVHCGFIGRLVRLTVSFGKNWITWLCAITSIKPVLRKVSGVLWSAVPTMRLTSTSG